MINCWYEPGERRLGVPPLSAHCWSHHGKIKAHTLLVKQIMKDNRRCQNWFFKEIWRSPLQGLWTWVVNIITDTSDTFRDNVKPLFSCDARHSLPSVLQPHIWLPWRAGMALAHRSAIFSLFSRCWNIDDGLGGQLNSWAQHHHHMGYAEVQIKIWSTGV